MKRDISSPGLEMQETESLVLKKLICVIVLLPALLLGQRFPDDKIHAIFQEGMSLSLNGKYDEAKVLFEKEEFKSVKYPLYYICLAANEMGLIHDYSHPTTGTKILENLRKAEQIVAGLEKNSPNDIWLHYCRGLIYGYRAIYNAYESEWLTFIDNGLDAVSAYEKCLEIDENFSDAYATIGAFKFWRSEKLSFLNWLPFVTDGREEGQKMLEKAMKNPSYHSYFIYKNLFDIHYLKKDYVKAKYYLDEGLKIYPECSIFLIDQARLTAVENPVKAVDLYWGIIKSFNKKYVKNRIEEIRIKARIVGLYQRGGDIQNAKKLADEILSTTGLSEYESDKLERSLKRVKEIRSELK